MAHPEYSIAIPTLKRYGQLSTVKFLKGLQEATTIFVHSKQELELYRSFDPDLNYHNADTPIGMQNIRNYMLDFYPRGQWVIFFDDDVKGLLTLSPDGKKLVRISETLVKGFIEKAIEFCEKVGASMWGVYPIRNSFFMSRSVSPNNFIIGQLMGIKISEIRCDPELFLKSDYDLTLKHIMRDGKAARFNHICLDAKQRTNPGGCVSYRDDDKMEKATTRLLELHGNAVRLNPKRKNEVLMNLKVKK